MKDQVVNLVVSVNGVSPVLRLKFLVPKKCQHLLNMRYLSDWSFSININSRGLCFGDRREGSDLTIVEARRLAIVLQSYISGIDPVELGQCSDSIVPPAVKINDQSYYSRYLVPTFLSFQQVLHQA
jgi:hypothetical protein